MNPPPVKTKVDFMRRYAAHEFGNHSPTWTDLDEFLAWGQRVVSRDQLVPGLYHLRNGHAASGVTYYNQTWSAAAARWCEQRDRAGWYCSRMVPPEVGRTLRIQGEVMRDVGGLYLYYTTLAKPMRWALAEAGREAKGLTAQLLLQGALPWEDWEWLTYLLDRYPDHVVEFGSYERRWGTENRHTIWWEVRQY